MDFDVERYQSSPLRQAQIMDEELEATSEDHEKWGSEDGSNLVISYRVAVKQTLRGSVSGEVKIEYLGADVSSPDTRGFGPLEVGERYLL